MELVLDLIGEQCITLATRTLLLPDDQRAWIASELAGAQILADSVDRTRTGWPLRIVIARTGDTWSAHAFYAFFEHAATAAIRGPTRAAIERCIDTLRSGRPRWTDGVTALVELWDVPEGPGPLL
ncbi:MAG: hypothetical protein ACKV2T_16390 [Kofleriaceae bacterium]